MSLLSVEHLSKRFELRRSTLDALRGRPRPMLQAVNDVNLAIERGEALGIVGESGCGKSTLARLLVRLYAPDTGSIAYDGADVLALAGSQRRAFNRRVQMVFQDPYSSLNPRMTVGQALAEALRVHEVVPAASIQARVLELLELVHLPPESAGRYPHAFSGGQRQRIGIARALAVEPAVIVADEPVSALDVSVQAQIVNLFLELQERLGLTLLFITHDLRLVRHVTHRLAVMYLGRVVESGPTADIFAAPRHPYTQALLAAAPRLVPGRRRREAATRGELPGAAAIPPGCAFHPRCPVAVARCRTELPALLPRGNAPWPTACHLAGDPRMTDRILIWGAGAIGGTIGAYLVRAGADVAFVDIAADHVAAINAEGLRITGPIEQFTIHAPAFTPDQVSGVWPQIWLAVKAHHTEQACQALAPHLAPDAFVLSLQNGLCENVIAGIVGRIGTIGAFVNFSADWIAPGEIMFGGRGAVVLGELDGRITPRLESLHRRLLGFEPNAIVTPDIWSYLWGKLGYGAMLFAQALGQQGIADCLARPELLPLWRRLAAESIAVARAEGVTPRGFNGYDPDAFAPGATEAQAAASVAAMVAFNRPNAKTHSGVWRDLAIRRRRTEIDVQIAPIATIGARHGIPTPTIARLVTMIHEIEAGTRPMTDNNLLELLA